MVTYRFKRPKQYDDKEKHINVKLPQQFIIKNDGGHASKGDMFLNISSGKLEKVEEEDYGVPSSEFQLLVEEPKSIKILRRFVNKKYNVDVGLPVNCTIHASGKIKEGYKVLNWTTETFDVVNEKMIGEDCENCLLVIEEF